ncbi:MAG: hypothetical protein HGA45_14740 [Chloroflexales bacterium]|nr:hypothetical protein [Chloroflexales bacterium]
MAAFQRPSRSVALVVALVIIVGGLLGALALRATSTPTARAAERAALLGVVGEADAATLNAPAAQVGIGSWIPMGSMAFQGAEATSAPAAVSWGPGRLDVFVRGRNGELYQNYREGSWSGWRVPDPFRGVVLRSAPACAAWGVGRLSCVALIESDNEIWHFYWDGSGWARQSLGGGGISAPAVVSPAADQLAVFVAGTGSKLYAKSWVRGRWSDWRDLGGELRSAPACAAWSGNDLIQCFVTSTQGWIMRQEVRIGEGFVEGRGYVQVSTRTQGGNDIIIGSAPAATAIGPGRIALLVLNAGQNLYTTTWASSDQVVWQPSGDPASPLLNSAPSCAFASGRLDCFARGPDSRMLNGFGDILQSVGSIP